MPDPQNSQPQVATPSQDPFNAAAGSVRTTPFGATPGLLEAGNIDLYHRPYVMNPDGEQSTVRSMSFDEDGKEVLVPTVSDDGKILSTDEAIENYRKTGKHMGKFDSPDNATSYAQQVHNDYAAGKYGTSPGIQTTPFNRTVVSKTPPAKPIPISEANPVPSIFDGLRVMASNVYHHPDQALADARQAVNNKGAEVVDALGTEAKNIVLDPHARTNFLVGLVQPGGEGMPEEFNGLRVKKAGIVPESYADRPMPETPAPHSQEVADLQAKNPARLVGPEDVTKLNLETSAQNNIAAGLRGERGDEASQIREEHRAKISSDNEQKSAKQIIQDAGLVYKGELVPDSNVHMFEDPAHPGKTVAMKGAEITPESVKQKVSQKLKEFGIATEGLAKK